jgi:hypothetical protein
MKKRFDKLVATVLAFLILALPGALSARERRGANLVITLKDGHSVTGELIAVKPDSLLLLNPAGKDESVDRVGIRNIRVVRKLAWSFPLWGFLAGAGVGAAIGYNFYIISPATDIHEKRKQAIWGGAIGGAAVGLIGLGAGALAGIDKTIHLEGKSESEVGKALAYLRNKARIHD